MKTLILWASFLASVGAFAQTSVQMRAVPTVGELVSRVPVGSEAIQVLGKSAAGYIGPARTFRSVTGLPSGGTNVAHVFASGVSNVYWVSTDRSDWDQDARWWGAFPDDGVDDTTALQAAIDYCGVNSGAAVVYVPSGSYDLRSTLMVTNTVRLLGGHKDKTILKYYGTNYAIQIGGGTNFLTRGASLENLFVIGWADPPFDGSYAPSNALGMVHVYGGVRGSLKNIRVSNAATGSGLLFDRRAWYWDVDNFAAFDCGVGMNFQCWAPGAGDLVNTINVSGGNIAGCDIGVLTGVTNAPSGTAERGIATLKFNNISIESNRRIGMWLNQTEVADISTYWEGNGRDTSIGSGAHVRLGNSHDTNSWSVSGVKFRSNRFASTTNNVEILSANNVSFDGNDHQDVKGTGVQYVFATTNHFNVHIGPNEFARQNYFNRYYPTVQWTDGYESSVISYGNSPVRGAYRLENASSVFGDGTGSALVASRIHDAERFILVNSTNGPVEVSAHMIGQTGFPGVYMRTDGTEGVFGGRFDSGAMPLALEMNTTRYLTLDINQSVHPNRFVIGETNGYDKLTVYGNGVFGDPATYAPFTDLDSRVAVVSTNMTEQIGFFLFGADGVNNRRAYMKLDLSVPEFAIGTGYSSVGDIPVIIRSATGNDVATFINSGVTIRNGAGLTIGAETITDLTGSGITIVGGALTATATPYTTFWPDLTNALVAGANATLAYDTGLQKLTISSSGGGGNVYTTSNNVFTATNYMLGPLVVSNGAARPALYVYGTNATGGSMQGGYLQSTEYASAAQNNFELSTISNATAAANSNIRLTVAGWRTADSQTNVHIGFNMGGTAYSSVTAKRDPAGDGFVSIRGNAMAGASDLTEEGHIRMQSTGLSIETMKGGLALAPITGVTRIPGAASLTAPSSGEGIEISYDNDETSYGGAGLGTLIAFDRSTTTWGAMRIRGTNVIIGSAAATSISTAELIVSNSVVLVQANAIRLSSMSGPLIRSGSGSPESVVTAPIGSLYLRTDGGASTTLYIKESGTGNTGWIAK